MPQPRLVDANGIQLAVSEAGEGPPVVLLHGFPELAYSWRHQIPVLADAGLRAIAYDQRGYGESSKPDSIEAYTITALVDDLIGLLDAERIDSAALVGHDWGSIVAWSAALMFPERVSRVISLNVPYRGWCTGFPSTDYIKAHLVDRFGYVLYFQEPGRVEKSFAADPGRWLRRSYHGVTANTEFQGDDEFGVYVDAFTAGGITGPVNWYRNIDVNLEITAHLQDAEVSQPTLMVTTDSDPVLPASLAGGMSRWVPDLRIAHVENCGHWTQQEQPGRVNELLTSFLTVS
ncbi:MAG: alpha/beta hydrolase [Acidimicrobiia bacterium]|nr:MAG: alpha/beta hydrolase [Acidimicrobiia bacterium]